MNETHVWLGGGILLPLKKNYLTDELIRVIHHPQ